MNGVADERDPNYDSDCTVSIAQGCRVSPGRGAGGKGVWGKLGDELYVNGVADERDPNYDSDCTVSIAQGCKVSPGRGGLVASLSVKLKNWL